MSTTFHRHSLKQNANMSMLYLLLQSVSFDTLLRSYTLLLWSVSQKIDDLPVLATCQSGTLSTLSSNIKGLVVCKSNRE